MYVCMYACMYVCMNKNAYSHWEKNSAVFKEPMDILKKHQMTNQNPNLFLFFSCSFAILLLFLLSLTFFLLPQVEQKRVAIS